MRFVDKEFDDLWDRSLTYRYGFFYFFLFLQTHPHLYKECMSLYFLGGGMWYIGAILAQNTRLNYRHISLYPHIGIRFKAHTIAYRKECNQVQEHMISDVHIMQLSEVDHKNNTVKSNKGLLQPPSQTTMMTRGLTSGIPNQDAGRVKWDEWDVDFTTFGAHEPPKIKV